MVFLRQPARGDRAEVEAAYHRSVDLHHPWTTAPANFDTYLDQAHRYFLCRTTDEVIVGTFHISAIVRGPFHSAYLGYEVFAPHQGQGLMRQGMQLLLEEAFENLNLHRLEANIQPGNAASIRLVSQAGFVKEGFSRQYLRVGGGEWKDHERWAVINQNWTDPEAQNSL